MNFESRDYALTPKDKTILLEAITVPYKDAAQTAFNRALELAAERNEQVDVHAHNQWWDAIYSAYPDGSLFRHATGRKNGWLISPEDIAIERAMVRTDSTV